MRKHGRIVAAMLFGLGLASAMFRPRDVAGAPIDGTAAGSPAVVLVELFTSEGCSSCPPADDVLTRLTITQPIPGVTVVGLGEHVDYWDRLGWRDPFSSASLTNRQSQYGSAVFRNGSIYTPQMVIDGRLEGVGSDSSAIRRAIVEAAKASKAMLDVSAVRDGDAVRVGLRIDASTHTGPHEAADVTVAMTEDRLVTEVRRGENRGHTLRHSAVVRTLDIIGEWLPDDRSFAKNVSIALVREWKPENLRIVAFLQERRSRRVVGVGSVALDAGGERR